MTFFGHNLEKQELDIIKNLIQREGQLIGIIDRLTKPAVDTKPIFVISTIINKTLYIMADISLTLGVPANSGIFTLLDNKTKSPLTGVTFSNQAIGANSNPAAATFAFDANFGVIPTAIGAGAGTIVFSTHAAYTDPGDNSAKEGDFTITKNFTVVAAADGVSFDVIFS